MFATERDAPFTKLALDVLGAFFQVFERQHFNQQEQHKICELLLGVYIYLNAQSEEWRNLLLQVISNHSVDLFNVSCELLLKQ